MVHEGGHQLGLGHSVNTVDKGDDDQTNMMGYPTRYFGMSIFKDRRDRFTQNQAKTILSQWQRGNLNWSRNTSSAQSDNPGSFMPMWFYKIYHSSSPYEPYKGSVKKGDKIPKPLVK